MTLLRRVLMLVGTIVCVAALTFTGFYWYRSGWVEQFIPRPAEPPPVTMYLYGPKLCVLGDLTYFHADIYGTRGRPVWTVSPPSAGQINLVTIDGRTAEFRPAEPGPATLHMSVAGEGLQVHSQAFDVEVVELLEDEPPSAPDMLPAMPLAQALPQAPPAPTVAELAHEALGHVESSDRPGEAAIVAGCLRALIGRIETGLVAPDADLSGELHKQIRVALGEERAVGWNAYVSVIHAILESLRDQGAITTAASAVPTLQEIAGVLSQAR